MSKQAQSWPEHALVGYVDISAVGALAEIKPETVKQYDVITFAFVSNNATLDATQLDNINRIKGYEKPGTINLISLGGWGGQSIDSINKDGLIKLVNQHGFDGLDLDIEQVTSGFSAQREQDNISDLVDELHAQGKFVTIAPAVTHLNPIGFNLPATSIDVSDWTRNIPFDAVIAQAYNGFPEEMYPSIIGKLYQNIESAKIVNQHSRVIVGLPTYGGTQHNVKVNGTTWGSYNVWLGECNLAKTGQEIVGEVNSFNDSTQFGGLSIWSLGTDDGADLYVGSASWQTIGKPDPFCPSVDSASAKGYFSSDVAPKIYK
ncbi:glycoside hydrolase family 18 protein [Dongshaea marina]|uniref:glycoside hydrolase family 18 protein n=1 Tax=Dongshaea marina TaxID=2047966 RepID=UPI00131F315E|nr:glycoside hydrolase family 18 protein [Dongshaea marina]